MRTSEETLRQMRDAQLIDVPDEDAPQLLADVCILSTYRAVYLSLQEGTDELMEEHRDWGTGSRLPAYFNYTFRMRRSRS
jgi:hypothetical protein